MGINLRAACVTAAKQAVKEYGISTILALNKAEHENHDIEKIKEICKKYAPDWQELLFLNRKDPIDETINSYLNYYFFNIVIVLACVAKDFSDFLSADHSGGFNEMVQEHE